MTSPLALRVWRWVASRMSASSERRSASVAVMAGPVSSSSPSGYRCTITSGLGDAAASFWVSMARWPMVMSLYSASAWRCSTVVSSADIGVSSARRCRYISASRARRNAVPASADNRPRMIQVPSSSQTNESSCRVVSMGVSVGVSCLVARSTLRTNRSSCGAVALIAISTKSFSDAGVMTRQTALTREYERRPASNSAANSGKDSRVRATCTYWRAVTRETPTWAASHAAIDRHSHDAQTSRRSYSAINRNHRAVPAAMSAAS
jgi:hypothetical protein